MIYWEKNKTRDMVENFFFYDGSIEDRTPQSRAVEEYVYKDFCLSHRYTNQVVIAPNFTLGGFRI